MKRSHCGKRSRLDTASPTQQRRLREGRITEDLVAEVTGKVCAMLLLDLKIEREQYRAAGQRRF